jgi:hypothetical protein
MMTDPAPTCESDYWKGTEVGAFLGSIPIPAPSVPSSSFLADLRDVLDAIEERFWVFQKGS